jgi:hypothetical protein
MKLRVVAICTSALLTTSLTATMTSASILVPIAASGWNEDVVIGAGEAFSGHTATMDGFFNWYGQGRNPSALTTGLPVGPTPSATTPLDLVFQLQAFGTDNAIFNGGTLTLTTPMALSRLALIGATGNGNANITVTLNYAAGPAQIFTGLGNSSVNGDWFGNVPIAYTAGGRVDVVNERLLMAAPAIM